MQIQRWSVRTFSSRYTQRISLRWYYIALIPASLRNDLRTYRESGCEQLSGEGVWRSRRCRTEHVVVIHLRAWFKPRPTTAADTAAAAAAAADAEIAVTTRRWRVATCGTLRCGATPTAAADSATRWNVQRQQQLVWTAGGHLPPPPPDKTP